MNVRLVSSCGNVEEMLNAGEAMAKESYLFGYKVTQCVPALSLFNVCRDRILCQILCHNLSASLRNVMKTELDFVDNAVVLADALLNYYQVFKN